VPFAKTDHPLSAQTLFSIKQSEPAKKQADLPEKYSSLSPTEIRQHSMRKMAKLACQEPVITFTR